MYFDHGVKGLLLHLLEILVKPPEVNLFQMSMRLPGYSQKTMANSVSSKLPSLKLTAKAPEKNGWLEDYIISFWDVSAYFQVQFDSFREGVIM